MHHRERGVLVVGETAEVYGKLLYLLIDFAMNLKLLLKVVY